MAKTKSETVFVCSNCGNEFSKWAGQCPSCGEWNSLREVSTVTSRGVVRGGGVSSKVGRAEIKNLGVVETKNLEQKENVFSSKIAELDRVLGKGIVRGGVSLFAGEPGIGKSTLLTELIGKVGGLYVAGEESAEQIALRVDRLKLNKENFDILETNSIDEIIDSLERTKDVYKLAVVDSIQVMSSSSATGLAGSVTQIRESTFRLIEAAKRLAVAIFIVGHVTKEGDIAGPKLLEHMVDTVLYFEGERSSDFRILRVNKNRFGPTDEVGIFRMEEKGLVEVRSEEINLVNGEEAKVGSAVTVVMEGNRPMLIEIQALVVQSFAPVPRRTFVGIDFNRGQMLSAVAQKSLGIPLYNSDLFVTVSGGVRLSDTGADAAVVAAIYSSFKEQPLAAGSVWVGEVTLLGEVRPVRGMEKRKKEAVGLGRRVMSLKNVKEIK